MNEHTLLIIAAIVLKTKILSYPTGVINAQRDNERIVITKRVKPGCMSSLKERAASVTLMIYRLDLNDKMHQLTNGNIKIASEVIAEVLLRYWW
jgi:hypothetical protein